MTFRKALLALALIAPNAHGQGVSQRTADSLATEVSTLKARIAEIMRRQSETDALLRDLLATLRRLEERDAQGTRGATGQPCEPGRASSSQWLRFELVGCPTLAETGEAISFAIRFTNTSASETLYIGARCCYADWLNVIDDAGQAWVGTQHTVTALPTNVSKDLIELAPGTDFTVSALVTRRGGATLGSVPRSITLTGALIRRTLTDQRIADRANTILGYPDGRPFTFTIAQATLRSPDR